MNNKRTHHQAPQPVVRIYNPEVDDKPKLIFDLSHRTTLQSYSFTTSVNDTKGEFSLTFYPDDDRAIYEDEKGVDGRESVFDRIQIMDIVQIYESEYSQNNDKSEFTGVIRSKKYVVQMTDGGPRRRILVSGHSIAGLVQEFKISMDVLAMELKSKIANQQQLSTELTIDLLRNDNKPLPVKTIVEKIWKHFLKLSTKYGELANAKVAEYVTKWMGDDFFHFDASEFYYPIGNVFCGEKNTESFYDLVEGIVSRPVYEIFPCVENGKIKIVIRCAPFDMDEWSKLKKTQIDPVMVKSCDVSQSDNEVFTVYFAYIDGYPLQMDRAMILSSQRVVGLPGVAVDDGKFGVYGYRPLYLSLRGYGKSQEDDTTTSDHITDLSNRLKEWFCNLDKMYTGKITMSTDISDNMPQPGEKLSFMGGEFYVIDVHHSWNYGSDPETTLTISRGGDYSGGSFAEMKNIAKRYQEFKDAVEEWAV